MFQNLNWELVLHVVPNLRNAIPADLVSSPEKSMRQLLLASSKKQAGTLKKKNAGKTWDEMKQKRFPRKTDPGGRSTSAPVAVSMILETGDLVASPEQAEGDPGNKPTQDDPKAQKNLTAAQKNLTAAQKHISLEKIAVKLKQPDSDKSSEGNAFAHAEERQRKVALSGERDHVDIEAMLETYGECFDAKYINTFLRELMLDVSRGVHTVFRISKSSQGGRQFVGKGEAHPIMRAKNDPSNEEMQRAIRRGWGWRRWRGDPFNGGNEDGGMQRAA